MSDKDVDKYMMEIMKSAGIRAVYTFAETALGMITIGSAFSEVNWLHIVSVSTVAAIASILKSLVVGMPEVKE